jgi:predicted O-methyltransferase YrrM
MTTAASTYALPYEHVAFSQTDQVLGTTGAKGDYLHRLVVSVTTAATGTVVITDGAFVHGLVRPNTPIGTYSLEMNAISQTTGWKVTTGAGAEVLAMGNFT